MIGVSGSRPSLTIGIEEEYQTIDPQTREVDRLVIDDEGQEFPRIDERRTGKAYRYAYTMASPPGAASEALAARG